MSNKVEKSTYYKDNVPNLIARLKKAVEENYKVIDQAVDTDLGDDKYVNVLKARKMAYEDNKFFLKEIESLENEQNGISEEDKTEQKKKTIKNPVKQHSRTS